MKTIKIISIICGWLAFISVTFSLIELIPENWEKSLSGMEIIAIFSIVSFIFGCLTKLGIDLTIKLNKWFDSNPF